MLSRIRTPSLVSGLAALAGSLLLNYWAGMVSARWGAKAYESPDLLFRHLPFVDMRFFFVWGFAAFLLLTIAVGFLLERERAPALLWSFALLVSIRSFFIVLTPMKLPHQALPIEGYRLFDAMGRFLTFEHDLFFSSHTAMPFFGFLLFRDRWTRYACLGLSFLLAATVLLSRLHYSIDVFGAYFITYALYCALPPSFRRTAASDESRLAFAPLGVYATGEEA